MWCCYFLSLIFSPLFICTKTTESKASFVISNLFVNLRRKGKIDMQSLFCCAKKKTLFLCSIILIVVMFCMLWTLCGKHGGSPMVCTFTFCAFFVGDFQASVASFKWHLSSLGFGPLFADLTFISFCTGMKICQQLEWKKKRRLLVWFNLRVLHGGHWLPNVAEMMPSHPSFLKKILAVRTLRAIYGLLGDIVGRKKMFTQSWCKLRWHRCVV